ncbi:MAG: hypoxanthine phosphoribosyltransferase [Acidobacteriota bacterium]
MDGPPAITETVLSERQIQRRVDELGARISADYQGREPLVVAVLRGAAIFHADLIRRLEPHISIDFIAVSSYGAETQSSGEVKLIKDLESGVHDTDLILVEDIVDTGLTLDYLVRLLQSRRPRSLRVCSLLSKPSRRQVPARIDYLGFEIPDRFVVGYGLDLNQRFRNLPYIGAVDGI